MQQSLSLLNIQSQSFIFLALDNNIEKKNKANLRELGDSVSLWRCCKCQRKVSWWQSHVERLQREFADVRDPEEAYTSLFSLFSFFFSGWQAAMQNLEDLLASLIWKQLVTKILSWYLEPMVLAQNSR